MWIYRDFWVGGFGTVEVLWRYCGGVVERRGGGGEEGKRGRGKWLGCFYA